MLVSSERIQKKVRGKHKLFFLPRGRGLPGPQFNLRILLVLILGMDMLGPPRMMAQPISTSRIVVILCLFSN